ncbi:hypothetical protein JG688_00011005 [Phytophthora aleatoria]|uniref:Uncharacterized protein n=1 Tax=Phytophthora aleatoria TaxID=2496075 RepID=A0A8J5IDR7_9STRA|nr:hypothetical protein JG688_00011005 [Phytophthora aleatoria]
MVQRVSIATYTGVMRGGRHRCIRSHSCIWLYARPAIISAAGVNSDISVFLVAMVRIFTEEQTSKVKKMYKIRGERVRDVFSFFCHTNCPYASVTPSDDLLNNLIKEGHAH